MINLVLKNRQLIDKTNYVRKADPKVSYWFDFYSAKLEKYQNKFGNDFCLIIAGSEKQEGDFYAVPFITVQDMFTDRYLSNDKREGQVRWIGDIKGHNLTLRTCNISKDVSLFYGNPSFLSYPEKPFVEKFNLSEDDLNDYSIENRKIEINSRQKQSVFRKKVLNNFQEKCCISSISESNLLRASHIIPWAHRIKSRLRAKGRAKTNDFD